MTKSLDFAGGSPPVEVMRLEMGGSFGELALLLNESTRQANVIAGAFGCVRSSVCRVGFLPELQIQWLRSRIWIEAASFASWVHAKKSLPAISPNIENSTKRHDGSFRFFVLVEMHIFISGVCRWVC